MIIRKKFSESFYFCFASLKKPNKTETRMLFWKYLRRFNIEIFFKINWEVKKNKTKQSLKKKNKAHKHEKKNPSKEKQKYQEKQTKIFTMQSGKYKMNILHAPYFKRRYFSSLNHPFLMNTVNGARIEFISRNANHLYMC